MGAVLEWCGVLAVQTAILCVYILCDFCTMVGKALSLVSMGFLRLCIFRRSRSPVLVLALTHDENPFQWADCHPYQQWKPWQGVIQSSGKHLLLAAQDLS